MLIKYQEDPLLNKDSVRDHLNAVLQQHSDRDVHKLSFRACEHLCELDEFKQARTVMLYLAMDKEMDTSHAILQALQQDKRVLVPIVSWQERQLTPVVIHTLNCGMEITRYGLRNPTSSETLPPSEIDLVVTPGLGFDGQGNRLGRGGGFYDRFLGSETMRALRCGFGFEDQLIEPLPICEHDATLNMLITEQKVRRFGPQEH